MWHIRRFTEKDRDHTGITRTKGKQNQSSRAYKWRDEEAA